MKVVITGANGFIGNALLHKILKETKHEPLVVLRRPSSTIQQLAHSTVVGNLDSETNWSAALKNAEVVVHCAARVHVMNERSSDPLAQYRRINLDGTMHLAHKAYEMGVSRFIYLSTVKVNGEETLDRSFRADDEPNPSDPYAISKLEAEKALLEFSKEKGWDVVIIRPPLVYGPGVKGNFLSMIKWLNRGIPLPLGAIKNKRSLVGIDNLVDLIHICISHPNAKNQIFLVSDGKNLSTTELLIFIGRALDKNPLLIAVPQKVLSAIFYMIGKKSIMDRLGGSLEVDISKTTETLNWAPRFGIQDQLVRTIDHFISRE